MGASVQFYGMTSVMQAAENLNCSCWGIFINGRLFCKYEAIDINESLSMLQKNLEVLQSSNANAIYTLKFFECNNDKPVKINDRSICDAGSFNFKLIDAEEREQQGLMRIGSYNNEIAELKRELKALKEETEIEPEPATVGSVLLDLLKNPSEMAIAVNVFRAALGYPVQNLGAITGIRAGSNAAGETINEEQRLQRLANSMDALEKNDPDLLHHLEKLAKMSNENPDNFKMLLSMLSK